MSSSHNLEVGMLGRGVLSRLHCLTQHDSNTLTLYVDLDQGSIANRRGGFVVQAEAMLKNLRSDCAGDNNLRKAADRAAALVSEVAPHGLSAVVVVHPESGLEEVYQADVPLTASAHWRRGAFLRPVVEAMDEHERYAVVLVDSKQARVFTVRLGEIVEQKHLLSDAGTRARAVGVDQWRAEKRQERRHDEALAVHAKAVIDALRDLAIEGPYDRLIIAGPPRATAHLARLLPRRLHGKLVETLSLPITATEKEVLEGTIEVQHRMEREQEGRLVAGLFSELHEGGKAVRGLDAVCQAVGEMRVWTLVYAKRMDAEGSECRECGSFSTKTSGFCTRCQSGLQPVGQLIDRLSQVVLENGGSVEAVDGTPADILEKEGSIGALLRY